ncbi:MAG: pseudouridine synthase [Pseudomonadales bacterium]|nr:pseudouridine synthase [Pseudomonadales bacterium]
MIAHRTRLDRFISRETGINRRDVRGLLAQGRITVDGTVARDIQQIVHQFTLVSMDGAILQNNQPCYLMVNKPAGVVSATSDQQHKTIIDLIDRLNRDSLHIAGRLDFNSTGLLLLTNDGRWSRNLSLPESKVTKCYRVELENPVTDEYISAFAEGFYFEYEGITTQPAELNIISERVAEISLTEGRYHQIKRMFGRFQNKVLSLHRYAIGNLQLDPELSPGQYRELSSKEVTQIGHPPRVPIT